MDSGEISVTCMTKFEWLNPNGSVLNTTCHKTATLKLIRNEVKEMLVEVTAEKVAPLRLKLKSSTVHNKFMNEGKASINFPDNRCKIFLSNAPISQLKRFLHSLLIKLPGNKNLTPSLLSNQPRSFEDVSPVTLADLKKISRASDTTPSPLSRKRKAGERDTDHKPPAAKKLYAETSLLQEPLDPEQQEVLDACLSGKNVFFTGSAGTGKSYLLRKIIAAMPPDVTVATASTGVAACHIGGITFHQFAGIGGGDASLQRCCDLASRPPTAQIWRKCKCLIIDEISMIDGNYFEKVESVARYVRRTEKPFGGIQLVLCGDFLQLPPVYKTKENLNKPNSKARFCFQTSAWTNCIQMSFELTKVHRQSDPVFVSILNSVRMGEITDEIAQKLLATSKQKIEQNGILATRLSSHTEDANSINDSKLNQLTGQEKVFESQDSDATYAKTLDQQTPAHNRLVLKIGAQVMLVKNVNVAKGLVNGARGVIASFKDELPVVQFRNVLYQAKHESWRIKTPGGATVTRKAIPLKLAWAFSIHKSQGLTLDCVEMSLARVFEAGQAYVALSRASSLETLRVLDFKASQVWADSEVLKFYRRFRLRMMDEVKFIPLGAKVKAGCKKREQGKSKSLGSKIMSKPIVSIS